MKMATQHEAIQVGRLALNLTKPEDVFVRVVHTAQHSPPGTGGPARVRLTRRPSQGQLTLTWVSGEPVPASRRPAPTGCGPPGGRPANSLTRLV